MQFRLGLTGSSASTEMADDLVTKPTSPRISTGFGLLRRRHEEKAKAFAERSPPRESKQSFTSTSLESPLDDSSPPLVQTIGLTSVSEPGTAAPPRPKQSFQIEKHEYKELGYMQIQFHSLAEAKKHACSDARSAWMPILCIEAELPGDTFAGREVFSHPLIVEASSSLFCTVLDKTSSEGSSFPLETSPTGRRFGTKVRIIDRQSNQELVPCLLAESLTRCELVAAMVRALEALGQSIPKYLSLLREEEMGRMEIDSVGFRHSKDRRAIFGMADSALAEVELAGLDGVLATRTGFVDQQQIVDVTYDSKKLAYSCLVRYVLKRKVGDVIYYQTEEERMAVLAEVECVQESCKVTEFLGTLQLDNDTKRALRKTPMRFVPLTQLQATRANRLIHLGRFNEAMHFLSPRQGLILMRSMRMASQKSFQEVVDVPILPAWLCNADNDYQRAAGIRKRNWEIRDYTAHRICL